MPILIASILVLIFPRDLHTPQPKKNINNNEVLDGTFEIETDGQCREIRE